jgi:hypothetical protein
VASQALARLHPTPSDARGNAAAATGAATTGIVVAFVRVELVRTPPRPPTASVWLVERWNSVEGGLQEE